MGNFADWFARSYKGIIIALVAVMAIMLIILAMQHVNASKPAAGAEAGPVPTYGTERTPAPRAVFLGDSYTAGAGSSSPAKAFPALVGKEQGWKVTVVGCGGSGYVNNGTCGQNYTVRAADVVKAKPDVVVVSGGRNDIDLDSATLRTNADAVFAALREGLPDADIYVTSPIWDDDTAPAKLATLRQTVKDAATAAGVNYIDIGEPLADQADSLIADGVHPNDDGYTRIADAITAALPKS